MNAWIFTFCFLSLIFALLLVIITQQSDDMQRYRRGHNGPDSKSGKPLTGPVGSNPTRCAKTKTDVP